MKPFHRSQQFLESLKTLFKGKTVEIIVSDVDETAYLLHSDANRERLLQAIEHVNNGDNLVEVDWNLETRSGHHRL